MDKKHSLADILSKLQEEEKSQSIDNTSSIKSTFDIWSQQNTIVKKVKDGNSTFYNQLLELLDKYKSSLVRIGHYPQDISDLEACLGVGMTLINLSHVNPVYTGAGGAALGVVASSVSSKKLMEEEQIDRRTFLMTFGAPVVGMTIAGAFYGWVLNSLYKERLKEAENAAHLLDTVYSRRVIN